MSGIVSALFGGGNSGQEEQLRLLRRQQAEQAAVEAGQQKLREGGGMGLLAYTGASSGGAGMGALRGLNKLLSGAS